MINSVLRFRYHCFFLYYVTIYSFFTFIGSKKISEDLDLKIKHQILLSPYSRAEVNSKESKIILDLKYKSNTKFTIKNNDSFSCVLDTEGKILGRKIKPAQGKKILPDVVDFTMYLNRKFLHSTLFGSIKLTKL